jgi:hypothetical protein
MAGRSSAATFGRNGDQGLSWGGRGGSPSRLLSPSAGCLVAELLGELTDQRLRDTLAGRAEVVPRDLDGRVRARELDHELEGRAPRGSLVGLVVPGAGAALAHVFDYHLSSHRYSLDFPPQYCRACVDHWFRKRCQARYVLMAARSGLVRGSFLSSS